MVVSLNCRDGFPQAFDDMEVAPQIKHHQSAVLGRTRHLCRLGRCVPSRGSHCLLLMSAPPSQKWLGRRAGPCRRSHLWSLHAFRMPRRELVADPLSLQERAPILPASPVRTGERLPVHFVLLEQGMWHHRECHNGQEPAQFITAVEGHYPGTRPEFSGARG